ncbi:MAG TPA: hypothetical protein VJX74_03170 [Blastocatellia bacterium]|nr:hypothetical protein [Blastocatellia bacterium]
MYRRVSACARRRQPIAPCVARGNVARGNVARGNVARGSVGKRFKPAKRATEIRLTPLSPALRAWLAETVVVPALRTGLEVVAHYAG